MCRRIWVAFVMMVLAAGLSAPVEARDERAAKAPKRARHARKKGHRDKSIARLQKRLEHEKRRVAKIAERLNAAESEDVRAVLTHTKALHEKMASITAAALAAAQTGDWKETQRLGVEYSGLHAQAALGDRLWHLARERAALQRDLAKIGDNPELAALAKAIFGIHARLAESYKAETKLVLERHSLRAKQHAAKAAFRTKAREIAKAKRGAGREKGRKKRGKEGRKERRKARAGKKEGKDAEPAW